MYPYKNMILLNPNLKAFLAVVDVGSVSGAGKKINLTQTAVTQRIKSLEQALGVTLFTRSRLGMRLTSEGSHLLRYCNETKGSEGRLVAGLTGAENQFQRDLNIVGPAALLSGRVLEQCQHIYKSWPDLNLRLMIDTNANRLNHLKKGTADIALVLQHEVTNELESKKIKPLEYLLVAPKKWENLDLVELLNSKRMIAYHPEDNTGIDYLNKFKLLSHLKKKCLFANENQTVVKMLELGLGLAVLPLELAHPLIQRKKVIAVNGDETFKIPMALAWYHRNEMSDYFNEVIKSIQ